MSLPSLYICVFRRERSGVIRQRIYNRKATTSIMKARDPKKEHRKEHRHAFGCGGGMARATWLRGTGELTGTMECNGSQALG